VSGDEDNGRKAIDGVVDALMHYIDEASPEEIAQLAARGAERAQVVAAARSAVSRAKSKVAQERRDRLRDRMRAASFNPRPDVSGMSVAELRAVLEQHVANDDASKTMAARHQSGEMDEAELRSVVADILSLKDSD
jgi:hypothetical protein